MNLPSVGDRDFDRVTSSNKTVLVEFWKPGCGHCLALSGELERLQSRVGAALLIVTMNTEDHPQIPAELDITSLPALAFYRNGDFVRFIGGVGRCDEIFEQLKGDLGD